jgi:hypothetical protein
MVIYPMSKNRTLFTIEIEEDRALMARRQSRAIFGTPGAGRKTTFDNRKKRDRKHKTDYRDED